MDNKRINKIFAALVFAAVACLPGMSHSQIFNKGFEYLYALSKNDFIIAHVNRKLDVAANKLTFTSNAYPVGFASLFVNETITEQSIIHKANNTLRTQSYSYVKKADEINKQFHVQFDWQHNTAKDNRLTKPVELTRTTYDPLSFQLALAKTLTEPKPVLEFTLFENKKIKTYSLTNEGAELLDTDAGQFKTIKVSYFDEIKKRTIILWCANELGYLPIQIKRIDNDGDYGLLKLVSLNQATETQAHENDNDF